MINPYDIRALGAEAERCGQKHVACLLYAVSATLGADDVTALEELIKVVIPVIKRRHEAIQAEVQRN